MTGATVAMKQSHRQPVLKPQDFYVLLALAACDQLETTYPGLSVYTGLSMSEIHSALKRAEVARLLMFDGKRPQIIRPTFIEFLIHGAKYAYPAARGSMVVGVPTGYAAAPLSEHIAPSADPVPVWPALDGTVRGIALIPLYPAVPAAALRSPKLYECLALFDAIRAGNACERKLAEELFEVRL